VLAYKDDRILTLVNDSYDRQTLNVFLPEPPIPADRLLHELMGPRWGRSSTSRCTSSRSCSSPSR
jgi:hypothetical protein